MLHGFIAFLCAGGPEARALLNRFKFYVVPMMNPDGVTQGNTRCSLAGVDLNRQFKDTDRFLHPTVFFLKELWKRLVYVERRGGRSGTLK